MKVQTVVSKVLPALAGCALLMLSLESFANGFIGNNGEQELGRYDVHSLAGDNELSPIPLFSVKLSATTDLMKGNSLDLRASYRSIGLNQTSSVLVGYNEVSTEFSLTAPEVSGLDFSQAIREKVERCPEKIIDKFIIDGAVGFNYNW